jgi:hypothetical protein
LPLNSDFLVRAPLFCPGDNLHRKRGEVDD